MSTKDLLEALCAVTHSYKQDAKEHDETRRKLRRSECKVRDLTVEIRYMADLIHQLQEEAASGMEFMNSPVYVEPPAYSPITLESPKSPDQ